MRPLRPELSHLPGNSVSVLGGVSKVGLVAPKSRLDCPIPLTEVIWNTGSHWILVSFDRRALNI